MTQVVVKWAGQVKERAGALTGRIGDAVVVVTFEPTRDVAFSAGWSPGGRLTLERAGDYYTTPVGAVVELQVQA